MRGVHGGAGPAERPRRTARARAHGAGPAESPRRTARGARAALLACACACGLAALAAACHDLPDLGVCGNGVVEEASGEACDEPGASEACTPTCELRCTPSALSASYVPAGRDLQGAELFCPGAEYRCGADAICRAPSGRFEPLGGALPFDVTGPPALGDVDNDGLLDLVGTSATNIYIRFASAEGAPLGDAVIQEAPSADAPFVVVDPQPGARDPMRSDLRIAIPSEGLALLRSDDERFAPELELAIPVTGETLGVVVRDPAPALGDVAVSVQRASPSSALAVQRVEVRPPTGGDPTVPGVALAPCGAVAAEAWRTVDIARAPDRRTFLVIAQREGGAPAWRACRYAHGAGPGGWDLTIHGFAGPPPSTALLANLDADACLELAVHGAAGFQVVDAAGPDCALAPALAALAVAGGARLLGAGQVVPGDRDELVLDDGLYAACQGGGCAPVGAFVRVAAPTQATRTWGAAALTDLNGDGALDVVAARAGEPDVDVVRGGATANVYRANTAAVIEHLVAGDFDGDRLGDVAMVESGPPGERIVVLFGTHEATVGAPLPMSAVQDASDLRLDRLGEIPWIPSTRGTDGVDDLFVLDLRRAPTVQDPPAAGFLLGDAARLMTTPRFPPTAARGRSLGAVAAGAFADPRGGVEILALGADRAQIYNVLGNTWVGAGIPIPAGTTLAHPIATLRDGDRARAAARGAGNEIVVFGIRGAFTSCKATAAGAPLELRGVDVDIGGDGDGDGADEVAVLYADGAGARSLQMFRNADPAGCALEPVLADALDGCVDVASAGERLIAICRIPGDVGPGGGDGGAGPARGVYEITRAGEAFARSPEPIARVQGDGRFLTAGDFDGDGVLDVAVAVQRVDEVGIQILRQCPRHDVRTCRRPL